MSRPTNNFPEVTRTAGPVPSPDLAAASKEANEEDALGAARERFLTYRMIASSLTEDEVRALQIANDRRTAVRAGTFEGVRKRWNF